MRSQLDLETFERDEATRTELANLANEKGFRGDRITVQDGLVRISVTHPWQNRITAFPMEARDLFHGSDPTPIYVPEASVWYEEKESTPTTDHTLPEDLCEGGQVYEYVEPPRHMLAAEPYAYKGGVARWLLHEELGTDLGIEPSDADLITYGRPPEEQGRREDMLYAQLAPDDAARGIHMEVIGSLESYVRNFDFTINEILATNGVIVATPECVEDNLNSVIRLSEYERTEYGMARPSVVARALRFYTQRIIRGEPVRIEGISNDELYGPHEDTVGFCAQLDRMAGSHQERQYIRVLRTYQHLPATVRSAPDAATCLYSRLPQDTHYEFAHIEVKSNRQQPEPLDLGYN